MPGASMQAAIAKNKLLTTLPQEDYLRLLAYLEFVYLASGKELCREGEISPYVYFPTTAVAVLQYLLRFTSER